MPSVCTACALWKRHMAQWFKQIKQKVCSQKVCSALLCLLLTENTCCCDEVCPRHNLQITAQTYCSDNKKNKKLRALYLLGKWGHIKPQLCMLYILVCLFSSFLSSFVPSFSSFFPSFFPLLYFFPLFHLSFFLWQKIKGICMCLVCPHLRFPCRH